MSTKSQLEQAPVSLRKAAEIIPLLMQGNVVPFLHGSPAVGKSSVVHDLAKKFNLELIDVRLSQLDPTDLMGFPTFDSAKVKYKPVEMFPIAGDPIPEGKKGWLVFLDEANGASHAVQMAAYKLILDRMVGNHKLHPNVKMVAAGNLETDGAIVNTMSSALISRFAHLKVKLDKKEWLDWATSSGIDYRITSFLAFKKDLLYTFNPDATEPYASPRTWEMVSKVIKNLGAVGSKHKDLIASMIGEGCAREFITYIKLYQEIPTFDQIMKDPEGITISENLGTQWAIMSMVCTEVDDKTSKQAETFLTRLGMELQVCAMRELLNRKGKEFLVTGMQSWFAQTAKEIYRAE